MWTNDMQNRFSMFTYCHYFTNEVAYGHYKFTIATEHTVKQKDEIDNLSPLYHNNIPPTENKL